MDQHTQVVKTQRRRSRAEVEQVVAEFESSGLSCTAFCRQKGLSLSTLVRYRRREQTAEQAASGKRWLEVEVSGAVPASAGGRASGLAVLLPAGWRIEIGRGFDPDTLKRLLAAMGRR